MVYPNPSSTGTVFFAPALTYQSYVLTDLLGRVLKQDNAGGSMSQLDLSDLPPGLYILVSRGQYGDQRFRIIRN